MKVKVREASGVVLDWLVAECEGYPVSMSKTGYLIFIDPLIQCGPRGSQYRPTTNWSQGGPIIERVMRDGLRLMGYTCLPTDPTHCQAQLKNVVTGGPTPLIAAMRCYVVSKLGEEVEVPDELA